jgi:hypothetical protein
MNTSPTERRRAMDEQLTALDKKLDLFMVENKSQHNEILNTMSRLDALTTRHNHTLYGNGQPGLTTRVDRQESWSMYWRGLVVTLAGIMIFGLINLGALKNQVEINTQRWDRQLNGAK